MTKLNQIIALASGQKGRTQSELTEVYHKLQKQDLLAGISRSYKPKEEDGEQFPPESKRVNYSVDKAFVDMEETMTKLWDIVATQDYANCNAKADVSVDGEVILKNVPVTHLLFLEKQLTDIHTVIKKLPVLDPSEEWERSGQNDCWATKAYETAKTKKVPRNHVKYEATKEHPAQVEMYMEDIVAGYWTTVKLSGAITEARRNQLLHRVEQLQDAVKRAREKANETEVVDQSVGKPIFRFLFES
jgi:hypothetical protein